MATPRYGAEVSDGVDRALPLHEGAPDVTFDVDIEIMEIPYAIRAGRDHIKMREPYLRVAQHDRGARTTQSGRLSIGLVWEVGDWDKRRSVPVVLLKRLQAPGVQCTLCSGEPHRRPLPT